MTAQNFLYAATFVERKSRRASMRRLGSINDDNYQSDVEARLSPNTSQWKIASARDRDEAVGITSLNHGWNHIPAAQPPLYLSAALTDRASAMQNPRRYNVQISHSGTG